MLFQFYRGDLQLLSTFLVLSTIKHLIDLSAILQKSLDRAVFYTILYARFDRVALEVPSLLCTFENSSNCIITSFDSDSFPE